MMKRTPAVAAAATAILALGVSWPTAANADTATTEVVVTLIGGVLSITAPAASVPLGSDQASPVSETILTGPLGSVQVLDARLGTAGWVASVISTALTPVPGGPTIGAAQISYTVGDITKVGTATYAATPRPNLTGNLPTVTATGVTGNNSATWIPTIGVTVDGNKAAGVYTGTITHSVL